MTIGGYRMTDRGFAIEVEEYEAGWSFLLQGDDLRIISGKSGQRLKTTDQASGIFFGITNTTRCFNNFFCWAICPAFFFRRREQLFRFIPTGSGCTGR